MALTAVLAVTGLSGTAVAQDSVETDLPLADGLAAAAGGSTDTPLDKVAPAVAAAAGDISVFIELESRAAVDVFVEQQQAGAGDDAAQDAAVRARTRTERTADIVVDDLAARDQGAQVLYTTSNAVPGVAVTADAERVRQLAEREDVRSIRQITPEERTNSTATALTNTVKAWQNTGRFGEGIRIGIIDDGVDYTHAMFGGPGTREAYEAVDRDVADPAYYPTDKVVGGIDLVGDDYDASSADPALNTPKPDDNPISCGRHGTHVAGSAAGFGVNADGSTFDGDYSELTPEALDEMRIGPGTAPEALIYSIKVFGCAGSTAVTAQALDWALDPDQDGDFGDRLDIVNLSLGSNYGAPDDPNSLFVRKLNQHGVVTVFSAGNGSDLYDIGGSPGNTAEAITVANTRDSYVLRDGARATAPESVAGDYAGQYSQDYAGYAGLDLTAPVVPLTTESNLDGCQPFSEADAAEVAGKIAWLEWDDDDSTRRCGSAGRTDNAEAAGAAGAIFSSTEEHFSAGIAGNAGIPVIQFTGTATERLRPALESGELEMRFAEELRTSVKTYDEALTDTPSPSTSRGTRGPVVKPDIAAPGDTIASALSGSGDKPAVLSGTSMAAPHTTGVAAMLRETRPDWTPEEIKAALMNTAGADITTGGAEGTVYGPNRVGSGRIDAAAALDNQVLAYVEDDPGAVSVSFGVVEVAGPIARSKTVKIENKGGRAESYDVSYEAATEIPGVRYELSRRNVTVPPGGQVRLDVTLRIDDPSALTRTADPTIALEQAGEARQYVSDASGRLLLTPKSRNGVDLRVPVYAAPKPVAEIQASSWVRVPEGADQGVLNLTGTGLDQGEGSEAYRSLVTALELHGESPRLPECTEEVVVGCTVNETAKGGDLRYVGATSTAPLAVAQGRPESAMLAFGITTWSNWYNVGSNTTPFVDIDVDGDGVPDFETYVTKYTSSDVLVAATVDLNAPNHPVVDVQPVNTRFGDVDTNVFDTNVLVLPVSLAALGIDPTAEAAPLSYTAGVSGRYGQYEAGSTLIDLIDEPMAFDPLNPGLWVQGGGDAAVSYHARPGTALVVNRDAEVAGDASLLLLHQHNASGQRAQVVTVGSTPPIVS